MRANTQLTARQLASVCVRYRHDLALMNARGARRSARVARWLLGAEPAEISPPGPVRQGRDHRLQRLEAVLFLSREPLTTRKLSQYANLADGTEARTLIRRLNELVRRWRAGVPRGTSGRRFSTADAGETGRLGSPPGRRAPRSPVVGAGHGDVGGHCVPPADPAGRHRGHPRSELWRDFASVDGSRTWYGSEEEAKTWAGLTCTRRPSISCTSLGWTASKVFRGFSGCGGAVPTRRQRRIRRTPRANPWVKLNRYQVRRRVACLF